ncbi:MAG: glycogen synthase GlgA [Planctomycetaceae bacterium]|nr:glycogen synthase GlgA [Planctomycetaceae bacterium]
MRILLAASEAVPFAKTGGLADVASGLSKALSARGHEVTLVLPYYRQAMSEAIPRQPTGRFLETSLGDLKVRAVVLESRLEGSDARVLLIDHPHYFDRSGLYVQQGSDYPDNCERFCAFSRLVMETARAFHLQPDIVHANDWQTGLIPALQQIEYRRQSGFERTAAVLTIHNMAYQGTFWQQDMHLTGLGHEYFNWNQMEHYGQLNLLKTGIVFSDAVTTVSPTYAREIQTDRFGCGLEGVLQHHGSKLTGILNGIDIDVWNPESDPAIPMPYSKENVKPGKAACKKKLQRRFNLSENPFTPLCGMISRMSEQKGFDLIQGCINDLLREDIQLVFLGTGDSHYEDFIRDLASKRPDKVAAMIGFDETLAHQIEAGSDIYLMPSRFEPCGLNQMYSQAYGTVPVVHAVGGLVDSVIDCTPETLADRIATGFHFQEYTSDAFLARLKDALAAYRDDDVWDVLIDNGMSCDWSWNRSAEVYEQTYERALASLPNNPPSTPE